MTKYESLLADATQLPVADRIQLIEDLWDTVPEVSLPPLSAEWLAEIHKRSAEVKTGAIKTVQWEDIRTDALRRLPREEL